MATIFFLEPGICFPLFFFSSSSSIFFFPQSFLTSVHLSSPLSHLATGGQAVRRRCTSPSHFPQNQLNNNSKILQLFTAPQICPSPQSAIPSSTQIHLQTITSKARPQFSSQIHFSSSSDLIATNPTIATIQSAGHLSSTPASSSPSSSVPSSPSPRQQQGVHPLLWISMPAISTVYIAAAGQLRHRRSACSSSRLLHHRSTGEPPQQHSRAPLLVSGRSAGCCFLFLSDVDLRRSSPSNARATSTAPPLRPDRPLHSRSGTPSRPSSPQQQPRQPRLPPSPQQQQPKALFFILCRK